MLEETAVKDQEVVDTASVSEEQIEAPESVVPVSEEPAEVGQEISNKEENMRALRESRRKLQQERDLLAEELNKARQSKLEDYDYDDDHSEKELGKIKQYVAQMSVDNMKLKLSSEYPDFKKVVNEDSIAILKERYPDIARTLDHGNDIYSTGVSAYNIIKKFGLHVGDDVIEQKAKVAKNISKPVPSAAIKNTSPLAHANDYSDLENEEVRSAIIKQAMEYSKNI